MNKKITICVSIFLIFSMCIGFLSLPASSYETEEKPSSVAALLVNLDTDTRVYEQYPSNRWYLGGLGEVMTFILIAQNVTNIETRRVNIYGDFLDRLENRDHTLDSYIGGSLTVKDLLSIMMLTEGNDAALVLANYMSAGDIEHFLELMNNKARDLGCTKTSFLTPGYYMGEGHVTTCDDMAIIYRYALEIDLFKEIVSMDSYTVEGHEDDGVIKTNDSMMQPKSPYYFRYTTTGKYTYSDKGSSLIVTTCYHSQNYLFIALKGKNTSEQNVFVDAKRLTTWAYLNLSDRKVIPSDQQLATVNVSYPWGDCAVELYAVGSTNRTLPNKYDNEKISTGIGAPDSVNMPLFPGQNVGTVKVYYDKQEIDEVELVPRESKGISMLGDLAAFAAGAYDSLMPEKTSKERTDQANDTSSEETEESAPPQTEAAQKPSVANAE